MQGEAVERRWLKKVSAAGFLHSKFKGKRGFPSLSDSSFAAQSSDCSLGAQVVIKLIKVRKEHCTALSGGHCEFHPPLRADFYTKTSLNLDPVRPYSIWQPVTEFTSADCPGNQVALKWRNEPWSRKLVQKKSWNPNGHLTPCSKRRRSNRPVRSWCKRSFSNMISCGWHCLQSWDTITRQKQKTLPFTGCDAVSTCSVS